MEVGAAQGHLSGRRFSAARGTLPRCRAAAIQPTACCPPPIPPPTGRGRLQPLLYPTREAGPTNTNYEFANCSS